MNPDLVALRRHRETFADADFRHDKAILERELAAHLADAVGDLLRRAQHVAGEVLADEQLDLVGPERFLDRVLGFLASGPRASLRPRSKRRRPPAPRAAWIDALAARYAGEDTTERRRTYVAGNAGAGRPQRRRGQSLPGAEIWKNGSWATEKKKQIPISSHQAVDAILDQVFASNPMHPAHHYRIHLWDEEKAARALVSASKCGQTSPGIAHMWHMPGHIYSKLHRYADAAWQQEASARVDHAHMIRDRVMPDQIHNYAHNNEWLIRNLAFLGRVNDALSLATNMIELPRHPKYNTPTSGAAPSTDTSGWWTYWCNMSAGRPPGLCQCAIRLPATDDAEKLKRLRDAGAGLVRARQSRARGPADCGGRGIARPGGARPAMPPPTRRKPRPEPTRSRTRRYPRRWPRRWPDSAPS